MKASYKKGALPGSLLHPLRNVELLQGLALSHRISSHQKDETGSQFHGFQCKSVNLWSENDQARNLTLSFWAADGRFIKCHVSIGTLEGVDQVTSLPVLKSTPHRNRPLLLKSTPHRNPKPETRNSREAGREGASWDGCAPSMAQGRHWGSAAQSSSRSGQSRCPPTPVIIQGYLAHKKSMSLEYEPASEPLHTEPYAPTAQPIEHADSWKSGLTFLYGESIGRTIAGGAVPQQAPHPETLYIYIYIYTNICIYICVYISRAG